MSHIGYMKTKSPPTNRIAEFRKARKMTQQELADAVGSHWITISKIERGVMRLSDEWRAAIASALGVDEWDLVLGGRRLPTVHVEGWIEEGGKVVAYGEQHTSEDFHINTNYFTHPAFRWLLVSGDALWPWYQDGDRICLWQIDLDETESAKGRVCLFWFQNSNGDEDTAVGILEGRAKGGKYTINRFNMPPLRNVEITALAVVAMAVYYLGPNSIAEADKLNLREFSDFGS